MSKKSYYSEILSDAAKYLTCNQLPCRTVPPLPSSVYGPAMALHICQLKFYCF